MQTTGPRVLAALAVWVGVVAGALRAAGAFTPAVAFLLSYLGYLVMYIFVDPATIDRRWRRAMAAGLVVGAAGFVVVAGLDVLAILRG